MNALVVCTGLLAGCCPRSSELEAWEPHLLLLPPEDTPLTSHHSCPGPTPVFSPLVMPDVRIPEQEERRPPRQCNSQKGKFIADLSQGSCRIQHSGVGSESPEPKLLHKFTR